MGLWLICSWRLAVLAIGTSRNSETWIVNLDFYKNISYVRFGNRYDRFSVVISNLPVHVRMDLPLLPTK